MGYDAWFGFAFPTVAGLGGGAVPAAGGLLGIPGLGGGPSSGLPPASVYGTPGAGLGGLGLPGKA